MEEEAKILVSSFVQLGMDSQLTNDVLNWRDF